MPAQQIRFKDVTRTKPTHDGRGEQVLRRLSVTIDPGQCVGLIGRSGSGKTTFLRLVNRLEDPDSGSVFYGGRDARELEAEDLRRRIALVGQRTVMFPGSVLDNILLPDTLTGRGEGALQRAKQMMEIVRLPDEYGGRNASALSVGQQARVQLGRALYMDPEVLLLDECTANLDPKLAGEILDALHQMASGDGLTVVHVSHEPDKLRRCGRLLMIEEGAIALDDRPATILDDPRGAAASVLVRSGQ